MLTWIIAAFLVLWLVGSVFNKDKKRKRKPIRSNTNKYALERFEVESLCAKRHAQIVLESMQIAQQTKKKATRDSRLWSAKDNLEKLKEYASNDYRIQESFKDFISHAEDQLESIKMIVEEQEKKQTKEDERIRAGTVDGKYYVEHTGKVQQLKREGANAEAIELLCKLAGAVEQESKVADSYPAPWYFKQLAILFRKEKRYDEEIAILEKYISLAAQTDGAPEDIKKRLEKAKALKGKHDASLRQIEATTNTIKGGDNEIPL